MVNHRMDGVVLFATGLVLSGVAAASVPAQSTPAIAWTDVSGLLSGFVHQTDSSEGFSGVVWLDYNNDGYPDLFIANGKGYDNGLFHNNGDGTFDDLTFAESIPLMVGPGLGSPGHLFMNNRNKTFRRQELPIDLRDRFSSGLATADYDNDGFVDIAIAVSAWEGEPVAQPVLLKNGGNNMHWLSIKLVGDGVASNRDAIGARVTVLTGRRRMVKEVRAGSSFLSQHDKRLHFGLGLRSHSLAIGVKWPSGKRELFFGVAGDRTITIVEGQDILPYGGGQGSVKSGLEGGVE